MIYFGFMLLSFILAYATGQYLKKIESAAHSVRLSVRHLYGILFSSWLMYGTFISLGYLHFGLNPTLLMVAIIAFMAYVSGYEDLRHQEIQDWAAVIGIIAGILLILFQRLNFLHSIYGLLAGGGVLLLIALATKGEGMGFADIKLMAAYGLLLQYKLAIVALLLSFVLGSIIGIALLATGKKRKDEAIAFGPYLSLGALIALFFGDTMIAIYFSMINIY